MYELCAKNIVSPTKCDIDTFWATHDKTNNVTVHPAKTQICLGIRPVRLVFVVHSVGS